MSKPQRSITNDNPFNSRCFAQREQQLIHALYECHLQIMNPLVNFIRRGYELLVAGANSLQSPFLLFLRVYFFSQLFMTGQGHLAHIGKVADFFVTLGIPLPTQNAYLSSTVECFGSLLLIIGLASRLTAVPVAVTMAVAYLTADFEAITSFFSDPDKFVKADPFPYFICALIVLVFGPGRFSVDALIKLKMSEPNGRRCLPESELVRIPDLHRSQGAAGGPESR